MALLMTDTFITNTHLLDDWKDKMYSCNTLYSLILAFVLFSCFIIAILLLYIYLRYVNVQCFQKQLLAS